MNGILKILILKIRPFPVHWGAEHYKNLSKEEGPPDYFAIKRQQSAESSKIEIQRSRRFSL